MPESATVVITGASAGVGRAVATAYGRRGARVALLARGQRGLDAAARDVRAAGGQALTHAVDVSDADAVDEAADRIEAEFGPIDIWVNDAFASVFARFVDLTPAEFRRATEVSYLGYVYGTMAALARMRPRDRGTVVQVGSALAYRGIPLQSAYCGAKHAIQGFNESLRCELLHDGSGVHVTMVQLPAVNTPQFTWLRNKLGYRPQPVPPIFQPELVARGVLYAADHPRRREHWVGGSTVGTLVANAIAPGVLDRYLARTGFSAQETEEVQATDDTGNLTEPADGADGHDYGPRGRFDGAKSRSMQIWLSRNRRAVASVVSAVTSAMTGGLLYRRASNR